MLVQRMQSYEANAQKEVQKKQQELLGPIYDKLEKAIKEVGDENDFIYVFDVNALLYYSDQSTDITDLVKKKLGMN